MYTRHDIEQMQQKGITPEMVEAQIQSFKKGFPFMNIVKPATVGDGIIKLDSDEQDNLIGIYRDFDGSKVKFVPASGAASRMFKQLYEFQSDYPVKGLDCFNDKGFNTIYTFFDRIKHFPFYDKLYNELWMQGYKMDELIERKDYMPIVNTLLGPDGLNYGNLPKALLLFHKYGDIARTAMEEHLVEGAQYARDWHGNVNIHFTVSPEHIAGFEQLIERVKSYYENHYEVTLNITYSVQKPSTDTIAVDMDNNPYRNDDGSLLFRPGGHGALIENLNDLSYELVFIKNIDNVAPDHLKHQTVRYKKALAGMLLSYRGIIFKYLEELNSQTLSVDELNSILEFTRDELCVIPSASLNTSDPEELKKYLFSVLNRPIRVCGMVKNEGEPGGGPFWAVNPDGTTSLQIVESSQIDMNDPNSKAILNASTHFNPVDIVCSFIDFKGNKFNLLNYRDPQTGFISVKSKDSKQLKALELPGLWNGAMSSWNTIFVEVPLETFSPVKTVNDLLRDEHQPCK
ncbi:MAG TPA: DUF4301 family protein [Bacteroidales bacterium]|nr:DUF4301 family protein [Bacteroidales bacterium]